MYDELIKDLRESAPKALAEADFDFVEGRLKEAADAIEERCQQVDKFAGEAARLYAKQPKWIPVTERLPEKYHQVLCYGVNGMSIDYYSGESSVLGRPLFMVSEARVTHWMPLPEPPKEE